MPEAFKIDPAILAAARAEAGKWGVSRADVDQEAAVAALRAPRNLRRACGLARAAVRRAALGGHGDAFSRAVVRPECMDEWDALAITAQAEEEAQERERSQAVIDMHADQLARQGIEGRILAAALRGDPISAISRRVRRTERRVRQVLGEALASGRVPDGQGELFAAGGAAC